MQEIKKLNSQLHFTAGFIDAGGIGSMLAEVTQQEVSSRIKPFTFTGTTKAPLYEALRDLVFRQKVRFSPAIIQQVKDDMSGVTRAVSASGEVRYSAAHTSEGHSDLISALVLLIHAWKTHPMQAAAPISFSRTSLLGSF